MFPLKNSNLKETNKCSIFPSLPFPLPPKKLNQTNFIKNKNITFPPLSSKITPTKRTLNINI